MDNKNWRKRFKNRVDLSSRVTHLTKGGTNDEAFQNSSNKSKYATAKTVIIHNIILLIIHTCHDYYPSNFQ